MGNLTKAVDDLDLIDRVNARTQTAVYTEDLIIDDTAQRKVVEHVRKVMPDRRVAVFPRALGVKAIRLRDTSALVISSDEMNSVGVSELETNEETDGLNTEEPTIHVVACCSC